MKDAGKYDSYSDGGLPLVPYQEPVKGASAGNSLGALWSRRWYGSPPYEGWSIMQGRTEIAVLGKGVSEKAVDAIIDAHNYEREKAREGPLVGEQVPVDQFAKLHQQSGETVSIVAATAAQEPVKGGDVQAAPLPELPYSDPDMVQRFGPPTYTADQMRTYGQQCALAALSQGWVSVDERLPKQEVAVLAVSPGGGLGVYARVNDG
ncbi:MAG: hypothetical protein EON56_05505, partial [Alphaproteobacteria bacterium]